MRIKYSYQNNLLPPKNGIRLEQVRGRIVNKETMTQDFITKVEDSFETLSGGNGKAFGIFDSLVKATWENDPEGELVLEIVYKILDLFNSSTPEQLDVLFSMETSEVIKMVI